MAILIEVVIAKGGGRGWEGEGSCVMRRVVRGTLTRGGLKRALGGVVGP